MTQLTTVNTDDYAAMAKAMGIAHEKTTSSSSSLARLRINHTPIMGTAEVNGKNVNVEVHILLIEARGLCETNLATFSAIYPDLAVVELPC